MNVLQQDSQEWYKSQLYKLTNVREAAGITTSIMARSCGLYGNQSRKTVARWEQGCQTPRQRHRRQFVDYLWSTLELWQNPEQFDELWQIVVMAWEWDPLTPDERRVFLTNIPATGQANMGTVSAINDTTNYVKTVPTMMGEPTLNDSIGQHIHHTHTLSSFTFSVTSDKCITIQIMETPNVEVIPVNP